MPVHTKDKLLQIRIEEDLFRRAAVIADRKGMTLSAFVRSCLGAAVLQLEERARKDAEWAAIQLSRSVAARAAELQEKPVAGPLLKTESALVKSRRLAKQAKAARKAKGAEAPDDDGYDD